MQGLLVCEVHKLKYVQLCFEGCKYVVEVNNIAAPTSTLSFSLVTLCENKDKTLLNPPPLYYHTM